MNRYRYLGQRDRIWSVESRRSIAIPYDDLVMEGRLDIYPEVESKGYFRVQFRDRDLLLTAGPYVGLIPVNPKVTIEVLPKLPVNNLARIIDIAQHPISLLPFTVRQYPTQPVVTNGIIEFFAYNLILATQDIATNGLYKEYSPKMESTAHPRGKIKFRQTALKNLSRSISHKVYCEKYEQVIDVPYNQLIKYALWFLSQRLYRLPRRNRELLWQINRSLSLFDAVTLYASTSLFSKVERDLHQNRIASNRYYYIAALKIALSLLNRKGISLSGHGKEIELSSYFINFDTLFESYLRQLLKNHLHAESPTLHVHNGNNEAGKPLFDNRSTPQANPDIVVEAISGDKIIVEVKYKDKVDRSDLNQAITYGFSYRAKNVVLVHLSSEDEGADLKNLGKIDSVNLHSYAFFLNNSSLENEERNFTNALLSIINTG